MKKTRTAALIGLAMLVLGAAAAWAADDIQGLWKIIDDKSGKPKAYVYLYANGGKVYGRMMATISKDTGLVDDTLLTQTFKAEALAGSPPYCGLDFVYELEDKGKSWKGSIIDPEDGSDYNCTVTRDGSKLAVRGSLKGPLGFLGRTQTWHVAAPSELPSGFTLPNPASFKPVIPKKK